MLHDIEQAMWYINMASAVVLFARLGTQGLVRAYPFLCAYLFADTLEQIVASVLSGAVTSTLTLELTSWVKQ